MVDFDRRTAFRVFGTAAAAVPAAAVSIPLLTACADQQPSSETPTATPRIDVHCHYLPDFYREEMVAAGLSKPDGIPVLPQWSESAALDAMDQLGVTKQYVSITSPGVNLTDNIAAARTLARRVNEEGARLKTAHPDRFGFFASTPLPDIDGALAEIAYALDDLGAAGLVFETNFNGTYLGNDVLEPVYAELNRRKAVLFLHPTSPHTACGTLDTGLPYPNTMIEFLFDTTRTIANMVLAGIPERHPNIRVIVPHGGAALSVLCSRIDALGGRQTGKDQPLRKALKQMHFDLAGSPLPDQLPALLGVADLSRIHYGSDWPFTPLTEGRTNAEALDNSAQLAGDRLADVMRGNSAKLFA
ncbi:putative metal-dependent hydrolase, TIM-barrel fold [Nocardia amikacinitolerans]|uniref:amidohydrolase family protein n=1 Tax=Nocardia amikacinitolerans TaxID=756689 RepID=UPI0020A3500A|nr:amidohydrolase family protein [Nocardia amikacinitolerans]MCP2297963.1 putative metal-dependent hydrolase, TIM-barrel fold [Nocardia amikacinitolerans]